MTRRYRRHFNPLEITDDGRQCSQCRIFKPWSEFHAMKNGPHGRASFCRVCEKNKPSYGKLTVEQRRKATLARNHCTPEVYTLLLEQQGGVCAICNQPEQMVNGRTREVQVLCVDHDHEHSRVRGLLCHRCNRILGFAYDRPEILRNAADYLEAHYEPDADVSQTRT